VNVRVPVSHGRTAAMSDGDGPQMPAAAFAFILFGAVAIFATAAATGFSGSIDRSSDAYHIGYSTFYAVTGAQARGLRHNPDYNPYLTMPRNEWAGYAAARAEEGDNGECDPFTAGTGNRHDYVAGANVALQDIALGYEPRHRS
jgi:hypothetical protein